MKGSVDSMSDGGDKRGNKTPQCIICTTILPHKGLKVFGNKEGKGAAMRELDQLHKQNCFVLMMVSELSAAKKKKAMEAVMFLSEKRDGTKKG